MQIRAVLNIYPYSSYLVFASICIFVDAYLLRIWERPYYELVMDPPMLEFHDMGSAIWYVIVSMTSVGFGNIVASTHVGRALAVFTILNGAFLIALLVGLILSWFELGEVKTQTINKIEESQLAIQMIRASLDLNVAVQRRKRFRNQVQKDWEISKYVPSIEEIALKKLRLEKLGEKLAALRKANEDPNAERDELLKNVQTQLLDLQDKFDRFLDCQFQDGTLKQFDVGPDDRMSTVSKGGIMNPGTSLIEKLVSQFSLSAIADAKQAR